MLDEEKEALVIAQAAALRINLPFVVIDVAQSITGEWIVIEFNDAQESGYAAMSPFGLWQNLIDEERKFAVFRNTARDSSLPGLNKNTVAGDRFYCD